MLIASHSACGGSRRSDTPNRQSAWHKEAEREFGVRPFRPLTFLSRAIGEAQTNFFCHQHFVLLKNLWHIM